MSAQGRRCYGFTMLAFGIVGYLGLQGCVASQNWVSEQLSPISDRVSATEKRVGEIEGRVSGFGEGLTRLDERISASETRPGEVDATAQRALQSLASLRLHRKLILDLREGANFAFGSAELSNGTKREIDGFWSDLKGDVAEMTSAMFLVAGHTDSVGPNDYNYELGRRRAEQVARYLILQKKVDPLRVVTVSYGKSAPLADNKTAEGRGKNRRAEILVYTETIAPLAGIARADLTAAR